MVSNRALQFTQVDVFGGAPLRGNPVAVVHGADGLDEQDMQLFAQWTNLSETTFLLQPTSPAADYRLRIFTPSRELPFAGHPTLGSAHAWLESGGTPQSQGRVVQECGAGLVPIERGERLAFEAPPLLRSGPVDESDLARIATALRIPRDRILDSQWVDNGPGWVAVVLADAHEVLALDPDHAGFGDLDVGVVGAWDPGDPDRPARVDVEVRAFIPGDGIGEDPVTGSLNASLGQWLAGTRLPTSYVAAQGTAIGRSGRVHVRRDGSTVWVGGATRTTLRGEAAI
ncbi:PhzF family phenazine biosynthesis protein [Nocardioides sp.]|uniref:PhzF family phenazine biosynthesis protein n=1 Tax=Nocardioides sp. TaxID=35761 RepID=UPI0035635563